MGDAVSVLQHLAGLVENAVGVGSFAYHQVSRGVLHLRGERPDVQVVHVDHSGKVHEIGPDGAEVRAGWSRLQKDPHGLSAETPRSGQDPQPDASADHRRSEEHTSELQSLMRISYAVFCLKKKNNTTKLDIYKNGTNNN